MISLRHCRATAKKIIYLIQCKKCKKQYVGKTKNTLRTRLHEHRQKPQPGRNKAVYDHFSEQGHKPDFKDLKVIAIDGLPKPKRESKKKMTRTDKIVLSEKERAWIRTLKTLQRKGDGLNKILPRKQIFSFRK